MRDNRCESRDGGRLDGRGLRGGVADQVVLQSRGQRLERLLEVLQHLLKLRYKTTVKKKQTKDSEQGCNDSREEFKIK